MEEGDDKKELGKGERREKFSSCILTLYVEPSLVLNGGHSGQNSSINKVEETNPEVKFFCRSLHIRWGKL